MYSKCVRRRLIVLCCTLVEGQADEGVHELVIIGPARSRFEDPIELVARKLVANEALDQSLACKAEPFQSRIAP